MSTSDLCACDLMVLSDTGQHELGCPQFRLPPKIDVVEEIVDDSRSLRVNLVRCRQGRLDAIEGRGPTSTNPYYQEGFKTGARALDEARARGLCSCLSGPDGSTSHDEPCPLS